MTYPAWLLTKPVPTTLPVREPNAAQRQEIRDARVEFDAWENRKRQMREWHQRRMEIPKL